MDLAALHTFQMVANEKSYSRAAAKLFRTQPAISIAMRKLEEWVGEPVFGPGSGAKNLTDSGVLLLEYAERMLNMREEIRKGLQELRGLERAGNVGAERDLGERYGRAVAAQHAICGAARCPAWHAGGISDERGGVRRCKRRECVGRRRVEKRVGAAEGRDAGASRSRCERGPKGENAGVAKRARRATAEVCGAVAGEQCRRGIRECCKASCAEIVESGDALPVARDRAAERVRGKRRREARHIRAVGDEDGIRCGRGHLKRA